MSAKLHTIQYLRALAAILVLISHALIYPVAEASLAVGRIGWLGVILFFVISGFIMVTVTGEGRFDAGRFMRRRIFRVVPLYWGITIAAAVMTILVPGLFRSMAFDAQQVLLSLLFLPFYNPVTHGLHPFYKLGWTLNYEMFFYLTFAALAVLGATNRVVALTAIYVTLAILGWALHPHAAIPSFYTSFMPLAFVAGAWLGLGHIKKWLKVTSRGALFAIILLGAIGLIEGFAVDRGIIEDQAAFVGYLTFATALVVLCVAIEPRIPKLKLLERLGDASYSIYLMHMFAVAGIAGIVLRLTGVHDTVATLLAVTTAIFGGLLLGWLSFRYIESPLLRRLRAYA